MAEHETLSDVTVAEVRGSGTLLRPGSLQPQPGAGIPGFDSGRVRGSGPSPVRLPTERAAGVTISVTPKAALEGSPAPALVLWFCGAGSLLAGVLRAEGRCDVPRQELSLSRTSQVRPLPAPSSNSMSPARPLAAKTKRDSAPSRWRLRSSGPAREPGLVGRLASGPGPLRPRIPAVISLPARRQRCRVCTCHTAARWG